MHVLVWFMATKVGAQEAITSGREKAKVDLGMSGFHQIVFELNQTSRQILHEDEASREGITVPTDVPSRGLCAINQNTRSILDAGVSSTPGCSFHVAVRRCDSSPTKSNVNNALVKVDLVLNHTHSLIQQ